MNVNEITNIETENRPVIYRHRLDQGNQFEWLKTAAGFANAAGGTLYVGMEDPGEKPDGFVLQEADSQKNNFIHAIRQHLTPIPKMQIHFLPCTVNEQKCCVLEIKVFESAIKPVVVNWQDIPGIWICRNGSIDGATYDEIIQICLRCSSKPYDQLRTDIPYRPEDFTRLQDFSRCQNNGKELTEEQLCSMGFFDENGMLSRGAELFLDNYQEGKADLVCSLFAGFAKNRERLVTKTRFQGNLIDVLEKAAEFKCLRMNHMMVKLPNRHIHIDAFPERALFKAIAYALANRDYCLDGAPIQIHLFKNRLEIAVPGRLHDTAQLGIMYDFDTLASSGRNQMIASVLTDCHVMDPAKTGLENIMEDYRSSDERHHPFIHLKSNEFTLTLPDLTYEAGAKPDEIHLMYCPVSRPSRFDQQVLAFCWAKPRTLKEIAGHLRIAASTYLRTQVLENLVQEEYLLKEQQGRAAIYRTNRETVGLA